MAISLDGEPDDRPCRGGRPSLSSRADSAGSSLAMQQLGLMASPRVADDDRRIEEWIASQLDLSLEIGPSSQPA